MVRPPRPSRRHARLHVADRGLRQLRQAGAPGAARHLHQPHHFVAHRLCRDWGIGEYGACGRGAFLGQELEVANSDCEL